MQTTLSAFDQAIRSHDDILKRRDLTIWVGAEPTFTDRRSEAPEWLYNALGPTKEIHAQRMLAEYLTQTPGAAVLR
ncbi:MAG: transglutaminase family protein, partial [Candidatus Competibacter sp.]|nr:transglutaminase family protein [Candidatus Competibacter sp.]